MLCFTYVCYYCTRDRKNILSCAVFKLKVYCIHTATYQTRYKLNVYIILKKFKVIAN